MTTDPPSARRDAIGARLAGGHAVVAAKLAVEFDVSEDAIRRDLRALAAEGRCRRVYGGALPMSSARATMASRIGEGRDGKIRLARAAAATIRPGELLFIDCGSTNLRLVEVLPEDADLVVATNAVDIAAAVLRRQDLQLIVVGGAADLIVGGCVDAAAAATVANMRVDRAFLGACSVSPEDGIGAFHFTDATFKRVVLAASRRTLVLATGEKMARPAPHHVAALADLDALVVEHGIAVDQRAALAAAGCRLIVADPD